MYNENDSNLTEFKIGEEIEHRIDYLTKEDVDYLEKEKLCFKVYAFEDVEKKGREGIDDVLKIDKVVDEQQLDEPAEDIQKSEKVNDNFNNNIINNGNNNINNMNNANNMNKVNKNKYGYSNNRQNLDKINQKNSKISMEKYNKQKNDKDCIII